MTLQEIEKKLIYGERMNNPVTNGREIQNKGGFYSIWISKGNKLPSPFHTELLNRNTSLIYIGIAKDSLAARLYQQELQHQRAATFFRSLGAVLGYRPEPGSLCGVKNQYNYEFSTQNKRRIIEWIDSNLEISFHYCPISDPSLESFLIKKYTPILNLTHNPEAFLPLKDLRSDCRRIAKNP